MSAGDFKEHVLMAFLCSLSLSDPLLCSPPSHPHPAARHWQEDPDISRFRVSSFSCRSDICPATSHSKSLGPLGGASLSPQRPLPFIILFVPCFVIFLKMNFSGVCFEISVLVLIYGTDSRYRAWTSDVAEGGKRERHVLCYLSSRICFWRKSAAEVRDLNEGGCWVFTLIQ
jgi:hypothetical protein